MTNLEPDCSRCVGLCCVALPFRPSHGFAFAKDAGEPCRHLDDAYRCSIHASLREAGMGGCTSYECFGAGQHVTQVVYAGATWRGSADGGAEMFSVFAVVQRLHEMLALLEQATALVPGGELTGLREEVSASTTGRPDDILDTDLDRLAGLVGEALRAVSRAVRGDGPSYAGHDLAGEDLRAHDLTRADLRGAVLIAADLRDAVLDRTDLSRRGPPRHRRVGSGPLDGAVPHPAPAQLRPGFRGDRPACPPPPAGRLAAGVAGLGREGDSP